ncbi:MAG: hypothetical protein K2L17_10970 [Muribaculaceae bacterium]|nr:hypothetical protein [Muribaculaceae bacterium]
MNIIRSAINLMRGVKNTIVTYSEPKSTSNKIDKRLEAFDKLSGCISKDMIDAEDPKTQYLLSK